MHQFNKAEMFVYCPVEQAEEMHEKLLSLEEEMRSAAASHTV